MSLSFLHERKDFPDLLCIIEDEKGVQAGLVEMDYWLIGYVFLYAENLSKPHKKMKFYYNLAPLVP